MKENLMDLGIMPDKGDNTKVCCPSDMPKKEPKPEYPCLTFRNKHVELFQEKYGQVTKDDEIEVTVKLRVRGFADRDWDKSIDFDVVAMSGDVVAEEEGGEEKKATPRRKLGQKPEPKK